MSVISRADAEALLARQDIKEILQVAPKSSAALTTFRHIPMSAGVAKMPVLAALPTAGFVTDDVDNTSSTKPTSRAAWKNKELRVEEIAVIIPIHENTFDDSEFNIWEAVKPLIAQEFGRVLDAAVFFGVNRPTTWDKDILARAVELGNVYKATPAVDLAEQINQAWALVEADGHDVNINYTSRALRAQLRGLRNKDGDPIYLDGLRGDGSTRAIYGEPLEFVGNGAWDNTKAVLIAGDAQRAVIGIRQDVTYKILTEATVGGYNLAEKDMIAIRAKLRVAFCVDEPAMPGITNPYPFAVLQPAD